MLREDYLGNCTAALQRISGISGNRSLIFTQGMGTWTNTPLKWLAQLCRDLTRTLQTNLAVELRNPK